MTDRDPDPPMAAAELGVLVALVMVAEIRIAAGLDRDGSDSLGRAMFHLRRISRRFGARFSVRDRRRLLAIAGRMVDDREPLEADQF